MREGDISEMAATGANAAAATMGTETKPTANAGEARVSWLEDIQVDWAGNNMVSEGSPNC